MTKCTEDQFLREVENHEMQILKDDGVYRHLVFSNKGSSIYRFDLITWPGNLTITGDVSTYTFNRVRDMFDFFIMRKNDFNLSKTKELSINPGYWGEKLLSVCKRGGYRKLDPELVENGIREEFENWVFEPDLAEELEADQVKQEVWSKVKDEVLQYKGCESDLLEAMHSFKSEYGHEFSDVHENDFKDYTHHYTWSLYAIVWGILKYKSQSKELKEQQSQDNSPASINELSEKIKEQSKRITRLKELSIRDAEVLHNTLTGEQSAWIEWQHGKGAEAAMHWIHNGLAGPGLIPDEDEPYGKHPQFWYDSHKAKPFPKCICGNPSHILWMGNGACCEEHLEQIKKIKEPQSRDNSSAPTVKKP